MLEDLKNKKILILGFGKEGKTTLSFLRKLFPEKILGIADQNKDKKIKERKIRWYLGKNYLKAIKDYDLIIKSPGIPIHLPEIEKIYKKNKNQKITSQTEIFFNNCPGRIIGVTGTKGKGTVASLIYEILKKGGIRAHLIGNIGKPVLSFLFSATPKDVYVYEISSHQLYNLKKSPFVAVLLNIYPDHLDFFKNFKEYIKTKANISRFQKKNDYLIYCSKNKITAEIVQKSKAKKIAFDRKRYKFFLKIRDKIPLLGKANLDNIKAAIVVGELFSIPKEKIIEAIKNFKPLSHRLEYLGSYRRIKFYNDSIATIPEATIVAFDTLENKVETIFLGGSNKNLDFKHLAKRILKSKIKNLILFSPTGKEILEEIFKLKKSNLRYFFVENMKKGVELAYQYTKKGKICLLSPASASFGLFKDYQERGKAFKKWVFKLNSRF